MFLTIGNGGEIKMSLELINPRWSNMYKSLIGVGDNNGRSNIDLSPPEHLCVIDTDRDVMTLDDYGLACSCV